MTKKAKWISTGIILYVLFIISDIWLDYLNPQKIGITWTIFWFVAAFGIVYFFCFKNFIFERTMYYAKQLNLTKVELIDLLPELKKDQRVPDPKKFHLLSPIFSFSLQNLDLLDDKLLELGQQQHIKPFQ